MHDPGWTAPHDGNDWIDNDTLRATAWLKSFVPHTSMQKRIDAMRSRFLGILEQWQAGDLTPIYDPSDAIAWYIFQAETFALDRQHWVPGEVARIVPFLNRLGIELERLLTVGGVDERAARLMTKEMGQPDGSVYELLVALAYKRHGWNVEFVPERPGRERTPDLLVSKGRRHWAVECKRLVPSKYALRERAVGSSLAKPVHAFCLERDQSLVVEVKYKFELAEVPQDYLLDRVASALDGARVWSDDIADGRIRDVNWGLARSVLEKDDVYFGASRMIELLAGDYVHEADHTIAAKWRPSTKRPFYAEAVYRASVVSWISMSPEAIRKKSRHFRATIADAEGQLPPDRPGVIHVGIESGVNHHVDATRHVLNFVEARTFSTTNSHLRWVYGNYFMPELTTAQHESWAITETTVPYKIGSHRVPWPLEGHFLVIPEGKGREGMHWDGRS